MQERGAVMFVAPNKYTVYWTCPRQDKSGGESILQEGKFKLANLENLIRDQQ